MRLRLTATLMAAGLMSLGPAAFADERCYGISPAGRNAGLDDREAPGTSTIDYQGNAWTMVPDGTCLTQRVPVTPDGTPRRGALQPLDRDRP